MFYKQCVALYVIQKKNNKHRSKTIIIKYGISFKRNAKKPTLKKRQGFVGNRRKSVNMDKMVVLQNNETSAPVTLKSASFHLLKNIKSPVKEKNSHDKE